MELKGKYKKLVLYIIMGEIIDELMDISNDVGHKYPIKFTYDIDKKNKKLFEYQDKILFFLKGFGQYLNLNTLVVDYFDHPDTDTHWDTDEHRKTLQLYLNDVIKRYKRINVLNEI